jgi:hypothetical protein
MSSIKSDADEKSSAPKEVPSNDTNLSWFGEFKSLARTTKDSILPTIDGIASMIHRSAMTVAAEIAQLERDAELEADRWRDENFGTANRDESQKALTLPWEVKRVIPAGDLAESNVSQYIEDEDFKRAILKLSTLEETFLEPYGPGEADDFHITEARVNLIRRLLVIDGDLASTHAKMSGKPLVTQVKCSFRLLWRL